MGSGWGGRKKYTQEKETCFVVGDKYYCEQFWRQKTAGKTAALTVASLYFSLWGVYFSPAEVYYGAQTALTTFKGGNEIKIKGRKQEKQICSFTLS